MSFFTAAEADTLTLNRMILHVVGHGGFQPEPELPQVQQSAFFLE